MKHLSILPALMIALAWAPSAWCAEKNKPAAKTSYAVVQIKTGKSAQLTVLETDQVKTETAQAKADYQKALKDWAKARQEFAKDKANRGKKFTEPKPTLAIYVTLKGGFAGRDEATQWMADYEKRTEKKAAPAPKRKAPAKKSGAKKN